jgi:hypothetical protein
MDYFNSIHQTNSEMMETTVIKESNENLTMTTEGTANQVIPRIISEADTPKVVAEHSFRFESEI